MVKQVPVRRNRIRLVIVLAVAVGVLLIMGLTAAYAANVRNLKAYSRDCTRISDLHSLKLALSIYHTINGTYPDTLTGLVPDHLKAVPADPLDGKTIPSASVAAEIGSSTYSYKYVLVDGGQSYELRACTEWKGLKILKVVPDE